MKEYSSLEEIFKDGIFQHSDILIFWGKRGKGKSSLKAVFEVLFMQPQNAKEDLSLARSMCERLNNAGFCIRPPDDHLVFVDTYSRSCSRGLKDRTAYTFQGVDFGLPNETHPTGVVCPCGKYSFDEIQDLLDSHTGALATFVSKAFELSRQLELFIMMAVQRPKRIPLDIRDLATFVECVDRKNYYNKYGVLIKTVWTCNLIYDNADLEAYINTKDPKYINKVVKFAFNGNIYKCYDSHFFMPMFYKGFENRSLTLERCEPVQFCPDGLERYYSQRTIDIPETYRGKKKENNDGKRGRSKRPGTAEN